MNKWKHIINIKQHLGPDTDNEAIVKAAKGVIQELNRLPTGLEGLDNLVWEFEEIVDSTHDDEDNNDLLDHFNYLLNDLYDFADYNKIWMGL